MLTKIDTIPSHQIGVGSPEKTGRFTLLQPCRTYGKQFISVPVRLNVYASQFDNYAVVSQDKLIGRDIGCISLKNCRVNNQKAGFQIVPVKFDGPPLTFLTDEDEAADWQEYLSNLTNTVRRKSSNCLPVLEEED